MIQEKLDKELKNYLFKINFNQVLELWNANVLNISVEELLWEMKMEEIKRKSLYKNYFHYYQKLNGDCSPYRPLVFNVYIFDNIRRKIANKFKKKEYEAEKSFSEQFNSIQNAFRPLEAASCSTSTAERKLFSSISSVYSSNQQQSKLSKFKYNRLQENLNFLKNQMAKTEEPIDEEAGGVIEQSPFFKSISVCRVSRNDLVDKESIQKEMASKDRMVIFDSDDIPQKEANKTKSSDSKANLAGTSSKTNDKLNEIRQHIHTAIDNCTSRNMSTRTVNDLEFGNMLSKYSNRDVITKQTITQQQLIELAINKQKSHQQLTSVDVSAAILKTYSLPTKFRYTSIEETNTDQRKQLHKSFLVETESTNCAASDDDYLDYLVDSNLFSTVDSAESIGNVDSHETVEERTHAQVIDNKESMLKSDSIQFKENDKCRLEQDTMSYFDEATKVEENSEIFEGDSNSLRSGNNIVEAASFENEGSEQYLICKILETDYRNEKRNKKKCIDIGKTEKPIEICVGSRMEEGDKKNSLEFESNQKIRVPLPVEGDVEAKFDENENGDELLQVKQNDFDSLIEIKSRMVIDPGKIEYICNNLTVDNDCSSLEGDNKSISVRGNEDREEMNDLSIDEMKLVNDKTSESKLEDEPELGINHSIQDCSSLEDDTEPMSIGGNEDGKEINDLSIDETKLINDKTSESKLEDEPELGINHSIQDCSSLEDDTEPMSIGGNEDRKEINDLSIDETKLISDKTSESKLEDEPELGINHSIQDCSSLEDDTEPMSIGGNEDREQINHLAIDKIKLVKDKKSENKLEEESEMGINVSETDKKQIMTEDNEMKQITSEEKIQMNIDISQLVATQTELINKVLKRNEQRESKVDGRQNDTQTAKNDIGKEVEHSQSTIIKADPSITALNKNLVLENLKNSIENVGNLLSVLPNASSSIKCSLKLLEMSRLAFMSSLNVLTVAPLTVTNSLTKSEHELVNNIEDFLLKNPELPAGEISQLTEIWSHLSSRSKKSNSPSLASLNISVSRTKTDKPTNLNSLKFGENLLTEVANKKKSDVSVQEDAPMTNEEKLKPLTESPKHLVTIDCQTDEVGIFIKNTVNVPPVKLLAKVPPQAKNLPVHSIETINLVADSQTNNSLVPYQSINTINTKDFKLWVKPPDLFVRSATTVNTENLKSSIKPLSQSLKDMGTHCLTMNLSPTVQSLTTLNTEVLKLNVKPATKLSICVQSVDTVTMEDLQISNKLSVKTDDLEKKTSMETTTTESLKFVSKALNKLPDSSTSTVASKGRSPRRIISRLKINSSKSSISVCRKLHGKVSRSSNGQCTRFSASTLRLKEAVTLKEADESGEQSETNLISNLNNSEKTTLKLADTKLYPIKAVGSENMKLESSNENSKQVPPNVKSSLEKNVDSLKKETKSEPRPQQLEENSVTKHAISKSENEGKQIKPVFNGVKTNQLSKSNKEISTSIKSQLQKTNPPKKVNQPKPLLASIKTGKKRANLSDSESNLLLVEDFVNGEKHSRKRLQQLKVMKTNTSQKKCKKNEKDSDKTLDFHISIDPNISSREMINITTSDSEIVMTTLPTLNKIMPEQQTIVANVRTTKDEWTSCDENDDKIIPKMKQKTSLAVKTLNQIINLEKDDRVTNEPSKVKENLKTLLHLLELPEHLIETKDKIAQLTAKRDLQTTTKSDTSEIDVNLEEKVRQTVVKIILEKFDSLVKDNVKHATTEIDDGFLQKDERMTEQVQTTSDLWEPYEKITVDTTKTTKQFAEEKNSKLKLCKRSEYSIDNKPYEISVTSLPADNDMPEKLPLKKEDEKANAPILALKSSKEKKITFESGCKPDVENILINHPNACFYDCSLGTKDLPPLTENYYKLEEHKTFSLIADPNWKRPYYQRISCRHKSRPFYHQNACVTEKLHSIGLTTLQSSFDAPYCCRPAVINEPQDPMLPYSPSIRSLPLDAADIATIEKRVKEQKKPCSKPVQSDPSLYFSAKFSTVSSEASTESYRKSPMRKQDYSKLLIDIFKSDPDIRRYVDIHSNRDLSYLLFGILKSDINLQRKCLKIAREEHRKDSNEKCKNPELHYLLPPYKTILSNTMSVFMSDTREVCVQVEMDTHRNCLSPLILGGKPKSTDKSVYYFFDRTRMSNSRAFLDDDDIENTDIIWGVTKMKTYPNHVKVLEMLKSTKNKPNFNKNNRKKCK